MVAALKTLGQSIESFDDESWAAEHIDGAVNRVVFHTLFFADLYLNRGENGFEEQSFHKENPDFFKDYEEKENRPPKNFYDRSKYRECLEFCIEKARAMLESETEATLKGESGFYWRKSSRTELHVYNTRHIQHHAAQPGLRNQLAGGDALKWVGEG